MQFYQGRLFDHVHLRVRDLTTSKSFYQAVLGTMDIGVSREGTDFFVIDELYVSAADQVPSKIHLAFQAKNLGDVDLFYQVGLRNGGESNGEPGFRNYHPGYYAAYLLDPDGNNIEAVYHGPAERSTATIIVTPSR